MPTPGSDSIVKTTVVSSGAPAFKVISMGGEDTGTSTESSVAWTLSMTPGTPGSGRLISQTVGALVTPLVVTV